MKNKAQKEVGNLEDFLSGDIMKIVKPYYKKDEKGRWIRNEPGITYEESKRLGDISQKERMERRWKK